MAIGKTSSHTRIEYQTGGNHEIDLARYCRIDARRVVVANTASEWGFNGDHAQLEIHLAKRDFGAGKRWREMHMSVALTPAEARALALAICPELAPAEAPPAAVDVEHPLQAMAPARAISAAEILAAMEKPARRAA